MLIKICYINSNETIIYAVEELKRYIELIDKNVQVMVIQSEKYDSDIKNAIWVGIDNMLNITSLNVENPELDDAVYIKVNSGQGIIAGINERSVLIAVYRFLREIGCAWVRPGTGGEIIPETNLNNCCVSVVESASSRHRGVCIEGAVSFDHVLEMIKWLPKVGMNSYYIQFMTPFTFYDRWYSHIDNPKLTPECSITTEEVNGITKEHIREIKKRGLLFHAVGHGWTCEPFGIEGTSWDVKDYFIPEEAKEYLALINGKRELFGGIPLNTSLCYSNINVRERMTEAIAEYCRENGDVDYLHFWLADGINNHCECDNCKDTVPADYYVSMLNMLDEKLEIMGVSTRIVFLIYCDLLWAPQKEKIKNPDRFVLMFAPITRSYSTAYADADLSKAVELQPYKRNKLDMPRKVNENVAYLKEWQNQFSGDSFIFDYHFMWAHLHDLGGFDIARVLFEDMKNLKKLGLNGMVSCQTQRSFFPSGLGMCLMAEALWNDKADFENEVSKYFITAFGKDGDKAERYLRQLSVLFNPSYIRNKEASVDCEVADAYKSIPQFIDDFKKIIYENINNSCGSAKKSWEYLSYHAEMCEMLSKALMKKALGADAEAKEIWIQIADYVCLHESVLNEVLDVYEFILIMGRVF